MRLAYLELGKIINTHGVRGELKIDPWCDDPAFFQHFKTVYVGGPGENPRRVLGARPHGAFMLLTLEGITDKESADLLRGRVLFVDRKEAPLEEGRFFVAELIGCAVQDADTGEVYGTVKEVTNTGATDVWQVCSESGKTYYMPLIPGLLQDVDVEKELATVRPIPGIFDDEDRDTKEKS